MGAILPPTLSQNREKGEAPSDGMASAKNKEKMSHTPIVPTLIQRQSGYTALLRLGQNQHENLSVRMEAAACGGFRFRQCIGRRDMRSLRNQSRG